MLIPPQSLRATIDRVVYRPRPPENSVIVRVPTTTPAPSYRHHVHTNSTTWVTVTQYVKYLGREGFCKVDQDEDDPLIVVNRPPSGLRGTLKEIHVGEFCCDVLSQKWYFVERSGI